MSFWRIASPPARESDVLSAENKLDHALALADQGFRVFPLPVLQKAPPIEDFPRLATTDHRQLRKWWTDSFGNPNDRNVGCATGCGIIVLDFDMKEGQRGRESLFHLEELQGLPETLTIRTPTGGLHKYFRVPADIRVANSASKIQPNVDVRGEGGYVVAPGSETERGVYKVIDPREMAEAPAWLIAQCGHAKERQEVTALVDLDEPSAVKRAVEYLEQAELSVQEAGGDHTAFKTAARVKDFGISEAMCLDLMLGHWNEKCAPPWDPAELQKKVETAYSYGKDSAGSPTPRPSSTRCLSCRLRTDRKRVAPVSRSRTSANSSSRRSRSISFAASSTTA
jgi:hypothetical protein